MDGPLTNGWGFVTEGAFQCYRGFMADAKAVKRKLPKGRHTSQIKRQRQNLKQQARNLTVRSQVKTFIKKVVHSIEQKDKNQATAAFQAASRIIQKAVTKGILHKNNAARKISRLAKKLGKLAA